MTATVARTAARSKPRRNATHRNRKLWGTVMSLPVILPFVVFGILPLFWLVAISFTDYDGFLRMEPVGLANYLEIAGDMRWWRTVANTLLISGVAVLVQMPLGFALAVMLNALTNKLSTKFRTVFFLPYIIPAMIGGVLFGFLVQPTRLGVINDLLLGWGLLDSPVTFLGSRVGALSVITLAQVWMDLGFTLILFHAGLQSIPPELYEAAQLDGAGVWATLRNVTLPLLRPMVNVVLLLSLVSVMRSFDLVKSLTNGGPAGASDVMFTHIYNLFFSQSVSPRIGYASALAVTASVIVGITVGVVFTIIGRSRRKSA